MNLLTSIGHDGKLVKGEFIVPISYCIKNYEKRECAAFYDSLKSKERNCFYTCPHGMSVYISSTDTIFPCMRERKTYKKKLAKAISNTNESVYNPIMDSKQLEALINDTNDSLKEERVLEEKRASIESISHEVKQLNSQIKDKSSLILQEYKLTEDDCYLSKEDLQTLQDKIRTIYISSSLISSRFTLYDYEKNPTSLTSGAKVAGTVYKRFDKMRKIFSNYQNKHININMKGSSYDQIMAYPLFDMIPLLLIENAVKYTYGNFNDVDIEFTKCGADKLIVVISSYSPYCSQEEIKHIFEKGYRGKNALRVSDGTGIGLFFVKMLCDAHDIGIKADSDQKNITDISGVAYSTFKISLEFKNTFPEDGEY